MSTAFYQPLSSARAVRLLHLQPGPFQSRIECTLIHADLDDEPPFEALSYVWGDPSIKLPVICNGRPFGVTKNLADALHRLRQLHSQRVIWVDAICINQDDFNERSRQVRIMKDIYSEARRVMVWLGLDEEENIERTLVLLAAIVQTCDSNSRSRGRRWEDLTPARRFRYAGLHHLGSFGDASDSHVRKYWEALAGFFARAWFTRVWCVQEVAMAQDSLLLYGDADIPWRLVGVTANWLHAQEIAHDFSMPSLLEGITAWNAQTMYDFAEPEERSASLLDALKNLREFDATDARDKVFASLGLVTGDEVVKSVQIDYERSVAHIYTGLALAAFQSCKDLSPLSHVQHPSVLDTKSEFPTWVPRWDIVLSQATRIGWVNEDGDGWQTSGSRVLENFSFQSGTLKLRGVLYDTVEFVSDTMDYKQFEAVNRPSEALVSPVLSVWDRFIGSELKDDETVTIMLRFAITLTCGLDFDFDKVEELESDYRLAFYAGCYDYINRLKSLANPDNAHGQSERTIELIDNPLDTGDWTQFEKAASRMCDGRRFFFTKSGIGGMGLGPSTMRQGDIVVVLFGGRTPFILRKIEGLDSGQDAHYFIGEAYVHPLMYGEAIVQLEDGKFEEREFEII